MIKTLNCGIQRFTHIVHIADIHVRLIQRHEEYTDIFDKFYKEVEKTPDTTAIAVCGDLFHNKSDLSPECVQSAQDFLCKCSELRPTVLIAGNHDATLTNKNRLDSLTPIVKALKHKHLFYLKDNGLYALGDILFNNMSIFSSPSEYITYDKIPKIYINKYLYHIALYHGPVNGVLTDLGFYMVNKAMPVEMFDGHHIALLGDIHRKQDLQLFDNANSKPAVSYPGSMIQQNHSETMDGHGFSLWDLSTKTYVHTNIPNDYGFFTVEVNQGKLVTDLTNIPKKARIHVKCFESVTSEVKAALATVKAASNVDEVTYSRVTSDATPSKLQVGGPINLSDIADVTYQNELLTDFLMSKCSITDQTTIDSVLTLNTQLNGVIAKDKFAKNLRWKPKKFEFDNMFSYGEGNVIDFTKAKDVMGLFAPNACGKSSIFSALSFCVFDKFDRGYKAVDILNVQKTSFRCQFNFEINGIDYFIERKAKMDRKGNVKVDVKFWKEEAGKTTELNGEARRNTNDIIRDYVGSYEDFVLTSLSVQNVKNIASFIDMGQSERKDLLAQFIGLTVFDKLLEVANDKAKDVTAAIKAYKKDDFEIKLQSYTNELSSLTSVYNDETKQVEELTKNRSDASDVFLEENKKLKPIDGKDIDIESVKIMIPLREASIKKISEVVRVTKDQITKSEGVIKAFNVSIVGFEDKKLSETFKSYQTKKSELSHLEQMLELKKVDVTNKIKKLDMLKKHEYDPNCKYCVNSVFVKDAQKISGDLEGDKITVKSMLSDRDKTKADLGTIEWVVKAQEEYTILLRQRNEEKDNLSRLNSQLKVNEQTVFNLGSELYSLNKDVEDYNRQIEAMEFNRVLNLILEGFKLNIQNLDFSISQKNQRLIQVGSKINLLKSQVQQLTETIAKVKLLEKEFGIYSLYIKAVNRDGLPYMVICNTVPEVEREVNNILNQIVEFHVAVETDEKDVSPYIVYDDKRWPIEMGSGFEKFIAGLAIRVALINISNLPRPNFLVIDEGFGVIDSNNMPSVQTLLSFLKTNFDFIVVVSHLDVMRDMVDKHIEVKKDNGVSSVNFV